MTYHDLLIGGLAEHPAYDMPAGFQRRTTPLTVNNGSCRRTAPFGRIVLVRRADNRASHTEFKPRGIRLFRCLVRVN
jgi:hypothetical protein